MPDQLPLETQVAEAAIAPDRPERSPAARAADHAAIAESIDELLPALIAKLGATGLAELEVREDGLRVRLRRPPEGAVLHDRRVGDRAPRGERARGAAVPGSLAHGAGLTPVGPGRDGRHGEGHDGTEPRDGRLTAEGRAAIRPDDGRAIATSPAVGIYHPRSEARAGSRVRAGDRLGTVDMLGVPQEVVAPADGLVGASLVDAGEAVEYGQQLVVIEFATSAAGAGLTGGAARTGGASDAPASPGSPPAPPAPLDH